MYVLSNPDIGKKENKCKNTSEVIYTIDHIKHY